MSWLWCDNRIDSILECNKRFYDENYVIITIFKFYSELCENRSSRLSFESCSDRGILLFRNVSAMTVTLGQHLLNSQFSLIPSSDHQPNNLYEKFIKPLTILLEVIHRNLSAEYVNFGMMRLYKDDSLDQMLKIFLDLLINKIAASETLLEYPESASQVYLILDHLVEDHIDWMVNLDESIWMCILWILKNGLVSNINTVQTKSCSAIDNLASHWRVVVFFFLSIIHFSAKKIKSPLTLSPSLHRISKEKNPRIIQH